MPFTLSHPAAVLLLARPPFVTSALVAGAVAPDLPYLLPQATSAGWGAYSEFNLTYTHELETGPVAGTGIALLLLVLFHLLLKRPLLALLPESLAGRLTGAVERFRWTPAARPAWIVVSAVIGVLTHLAWDALVHENGAVAWSPVPAARRRTWAMLVLAGLVGVALKLVWHGVGPSPAALRPAVAGGMSGVAVGVLAYALLRTVRPK